MLYGVDEVGSHEPGEDVRQISAGDVTVPADIERREDPLVQHPPHVVRGGGVLLLNGLSKGKRTVESFVDHVE